MCAQRTFDLVLAIVDAEQSRRATIPLQTISYKPSAKHPPRTSPCVARAVDGHARDQCSTIRCSFELSLIHISEPTRPEPI
eukprot:3705264-Pyramimonas_sp.AAC.1